MVLGSKTPRLQKHSAGYPSTLELSLALGTCEMWATRIHQEPSPKSHREPPGACKGQATSSEWGGQGQADISLQGPAGGRPFLRVALHCPMDPQTGA